MDVRFICSLFAILLDRILSCGMLVGRGPDNLVEATVLKSEVQTRLGTLFVMERSRQDGGDLQRRFRQALACPF